MKVLANDGISKSGILAEAGFEVITTKSSTRTRRERK
jgi:hypothetical protein